MLNCECAQAYEPRLGNLGSLHRNHIWASGTGNSFLFKQWPNEESKIKVIKKKKKEEEEAKPTKLSERKKCTIEQKRKTKAFLAIILTKIWQLKEMLPHLSQMKYTWALLAVIAIPITILPLKALQYFSVASSKDTAVGGDPQALHVTGWAERTFFAPCPPDCGWRVQFAYQGSENRSANDENV